MSRRGFDPQRPIDRPVRARTPLPAIRADALLEAEGAAALLDALEASGCAELHLAFDSLGEASSSRALQLAGLVKQLRRRGFRIHGCFTLGQDQDDLGCFERLVGWVEAQGLVTVELRLWTPDPGSSLVRELAREDRIRHRSLERWDGAHVVVVPKQMSAQTLYRGWVWAQARLGTLSSIWRRRPRAVSELPAYLAAVLAAKLAPLRSRALELGSLLRSKAAVEVLPSGRERT